MIEFLLFSLQKFNLKVHFTKFLCCSHLFLFYFLFLETRWLIFTFLMFWTIRYLDDTFFLHLFKLSLCNTFFHKLPLILLYKPILFLEIVDSLLIFFLSLFEHLKKMVKLLSFALHFTKFTVWYNFVLNIFLTLLKFSCFCYNFSL